MSNDERRLHPRITVDLPLHLTFRDRTVETRIRDLSNSGIRFRGPSALPLLSRVQIALQLPKVPASSTSSLAITGVVVRCEETGDQGSGRYDTAIYFEDLSSSARAQLSQFVSKKP